MSEVHLAHHAVRARTNDAIFEVQTVLLDLERREPGNLLREVSALRLALEAVQVQSGDSPDFEAALERVEQVRGRAAALWQQHRA